jgi:NTP pyrophosphatase (non-canonical NTP hydrolase)
MDLADYQKQAIATFRHTDDRERATLIALLGLAGESGTLLSEYKKFLRDGVAHRRYQARIIEDLGDVLWYTAAIAHCMNADLDEIALLNLAKVAERYGADASTLAGLPYTLYDTAFQEAEQLPRQLTLRITEESTAVPPRIVLSLNGEQVGAALNDNAIDDDGYRFHDVLHLAHAAVLGWSPVARALLKCKRRSDPQTDRVQDGGRAIVIEEGLTALIYEHALDHDFFAGVTTMDTELLSTVKRMTARLEVSSRTLQDWERAILDGYTVWRDVRRNRGGWIELDLERRSISYRSA